MMTLRAVSSSITNRIRQSAVWLVGGGAVLAIVFPWLRTGYLFFVDFAWGPAAAVDWKAGAASFFGPLWLLSRFLSPEVAQKIMIVAVLALTYYGGYRLFSALLRDRAVAAALGLFVLFNPFVYDRLGYGQITIIAALGLLCLGFAELVTLRPNDKFFAGMLLAGTWFGLAIELSPHFLFFAAVLVACWLASRRIYRPEPGVQQAAAVHYVSLRQLAILAVMGVSAIAVINSHWLIGIWYGSSVGATFASINTADFEAFRTSGDTAWEAAGNVLSFTGFWGKDQLRYPDLTSEYVAWARSYFVLLPLAIWGAWVALRDRERRPMAASLLAAYLFAAFMALGVRTGVGRDLTLWLAEHLPGYAGMRETQKWVAVEVVAFSSLLAWGVGRLFEVEVVRRNRMLMVWVIGFICIMQAPIMLRGMAGATRPAQYPPDWHAAEALLSDGGCRGNILFLPRHMYMRFDWIGTVIINPARYYFSCPVLVGSNPEWLGAADPQAARNASLVSMINTEGNSAASVFASRKISHVLLAKELEWEKLSWLDALPELRKIMEGETMVLYEVVN